MTSTLFQSYFSPLQTSDDDALTNLPVIFQSYFSPLQTRPGLQVRTRSANFNPILVRFKRHLSCLHVAGRAHFNPILVRFKLG